MSKNVPPLCADSDVEPAAVIAALDVSVIVPEAMTVSESLADTTPS